MSEWQPIETAPLNCTVLVWVPDWKRVMTAEWSVEGLPQGWGEPYKPSWIGSPAPSDDYEKIQIKPTHWMPLPPSPPGRFSDVHEVQGSPYEALTKGPAGTVVLGPMPLPPPPKGQKDD